MPDIIVCCDPPTHSGGSPHQVVVVPSNGTPHPTGPDGCTGPIPLPCPGWYWVYVCGRNCGRYYVPPPGLRILCTCCSGATCDMEMVSLELDPDTAGLVAKLLPARPEVESVYFCLPDTVPAQLDENTIGEDGTVTLFVRPGDYRPTVQLPDGRLAKGGPVTVPAGRGDAPIRVTLEEPPG